MARDQSQSGSFSLVREEPGNKVDSGKVIAGGRGWGNNFVGLLWPILYLPVV